MLRLHLTRDVIENDYWHRRYTEKLIGKLQQSNFPLTNNQNTT